MSSTFYYTIIVSKANTTSKIIDTLMAKAIPEYGCSGILEFSLDEAAIDEIIGVDAYAKDFLPNNVIEKIVENEKQSNSAIKFFFHGNSCTENIKKFKKYLAKMELSYNEIKSSIDDWNIEWKKHYAPIKISTSLTIVPEWEKDNYSTEGNIFINPGQGFGTGNHETTHLCLEFLTEISIEERSNVLDFGCGSGILGIAAIKLKNSLVDFCDIDRQALDNCKENITLNFDPNGLEGSSIILRDRLSNTKKYSLVFANLLYPIIREEKESISVAILPGGLVIISGILKEQINDTLALFENENLKLIDTKNKNDWSALLLQKSREKK